MTTFDDPTELRSIVIFDDDLSAVLKQAAETVVGLAVWDVTVCHTVCVGCDHDKWVAVVYHAGQNDE